MKKCFSVFVLLAAASVPGAAATMTGWFACEKCTASRVGKGDLRPSNPVCARECIEKGSEAVFISEQSKQVLKVRKYSAVLGDLGFHVEVSGNVDTAGNTIAIESVKRIGDAGASCARPRRPKQVTAP